MAIFVPFGAINPFTAGDMMAAGQTPTAVGELLLRLIIWEMVLLPLIWLLDPIRRKKAQHGREEGII